MPEFKIESNVASGRRLGTMRVLLSGAVLLLVALTIVVVSGHSTFLPKPLLLFIFIGSVAAAFVGGFAMAIRGGIARVQRETVFAIDETKIVRRRSGYPDDEIAFRDIKSARMEFGWLVIRSAGNKIAVPHDVNGFQPLCSEISKHCPMLVQDIRPRRAQPLLAVVVGVLPYVGGASLVFMTSDVLSLALSGSFITLFCTTGAYAVRRRTNRETAAHRLIVDPFLYGSEFALAAELVHYVFTAHA